MKSASGDSWNSFSDVKVSFTSDVSKVYVYVESSDPKCKLYIDDFSLSKAPEVPIEEDIPSLKDVYSSYFKIGTAITPSDLSSKPTMKLVQKHFSGSITLGNEMKPDSVLDQKASLPMQKQMAEMIPIRRFPLQLQRVFWIIAVKTRFRFEHIPWYGTARHRTGSLRKVSRVTAIGFPKKKC